MIRGGVAAPCLAFGLARVHRSIERAPTVLVVRVELFARVGHHGGHHRSDALRVNLAVHTVDADDVVAVLADAVEGVRRVPGAGAPDELPLKW